jgi:FHA domain-containing protein/uncharacterized protein DUF1707
MGGSAADTPATPDFLRASDADRDHAVDKLRQEFVEGRLSQETFVFRMQSALGARNRAQLAGLFTDLPPRRARPRELLARLRAAFRDRDHDAADAATERYPGTPVAGGGQAAPGRRPAAQDSPGALGWLAGVPAHGAPGASGGAGSGGSAPLFFPPGSGTSFTIGRTHDCDLRIENMSVSRLHAQLNRAGDGWLLNDLGSHNGTRVNGWLVREPVPVRAGDLVQFGSATFIIQTPSQDQPGEPDGQSPREGGPGMRPR